MYTPDREVRSASWSTSGPERETLLVFPVTVTCACAHDDKWSMRMRVTRTISGHDAEAWGQCSWWAQKSWRIFLLLDENATRELCRSWYMNTDWLSSQILLVAGNWCRVSTLSALFRRSVALMCWCRSQCQWTTNSSILFPWNLAPCHNAITVGLLMQNRHQMLLASLNLHFFRMVQYETIYKGIVCMSGGQIWKSCSWKNWLNDDLT